VLPQASETVHSGTGRIVRLRMRPMSLYESGESLGNVSLASLFEGEELQPQSNELDIDAVAYLVCR